MHIPNFKSLCLNFSYNMDARTDGHIHLIKTFYPNSKNIIFTNMRLDKLLFDQNQINGFGWG